MWNKAGLLVSESNSVIPAQGFSLWYKMVKSKWGSCPHLVTVTMKQEKPKPKQSPTEENRIPLRKEPFPPQSQHNVDVLAPMQQNINVGGLAQSFVTNNNTCPSFGGFPRSSYGGYNYFTGPSQPPYQDTSPWMHPSYPSPIFPPCIWHMQSSTLSQATIQEEPIRGQPFIVGFKTGNISVCNGFWKKFSVDDKILVCHEEFRQFTSPHTGLPASKLQNAYYHARKKCIMLKWGPSFSAENIILPEDVRSKLTLKQKYLLAEEFELLKQNLLTEEFELREKKLLLRNLS